MVVVNCKLWPLYPQGRVPAPTAQEAGLDPRGWSEHFGEDRTALAHIKPRTVQEVA